MTMAPIPVTIVTGFLGAGKTTLVNQLVRDPAFSETAILINEFGEVQIDHDLVAGFSKELVMTTTGCLCCTASSDITQSLYDFWTLRKNGMIGPFRRVIVETTGLVDPVPVIAALLARPTTDVADATVSQQFALARIVTLFDIVNGAMTLDRHVEALKQVALSDVVLLTKTDLAQDPATRRDIVEDRQRISAINPSATILDRHVDWPDMRALFLASGTYDFRSKGEDAIAWLDAERVVAADAHDHDHGHTHLDRTRHGDDIRSHAIILDEPVSPVMFSIFLDALKTIVGTDLLRIKGLIGLSDDPDRPVVVHGVQHLIHPIGKLEQWPSNDRSSKIVVIGRNLRIDALRDILAVNQSPSANVALAPENLDEGDGAATKP